MFDAKHEDICNGRGSDFKDGRTSLLQKLITAAVSEKETI
jgi:hypothetical protein